MANFKYSFNCTIKYRFRDEINANGTDKTNTSFRFSDHNYLINLEANCNYEGLKQIDYKTMFLPENLPEYYYYDENGESKKSKKVEWYLNFDTEKDLFAKRVEDGEGVATKSGYWVFDDESVVQTETTTSANVSLTLYSDTTPKTLTWQYLISDSNTVQEKLTTLWGTVPKVPNVPIDSPYIPQLVINNINDTGNVTNTETYYAHSFVEWAITTHSVSEGKYIYTANYVVEKHEKVDPELLLTESKSEDDETQLNIFRFAEPYHYGDGDPDEDYYISIGDKFKIQGVESNLYSQIIKIKEFNIQANPIEYIKKGTFPLPRGICSLENLNAVSPYSTDATAAFWNTCELHIYYDTSANISKITAVSFFDVNYANNISPLPSRSKTTSTLFDSTTTNKEDNLIKAHSDETATRLGFVLVGGGGGSGGISKYDPKKDAKTDGDYCVPGGGGGGGEIVCGVLNLTQPTVAEFIEAKKYISELVYIFQVGPGGTYGSHGKTDVSYNSPGNGGNGQDGYSSSLWVEAKITSTENSSSVSYTGRHLLLTVGGGKGGAAGSAQSIGAGGAGGTAAKSRTSKKLTYKIENTSINAGQIRQEFTGGKGGGPNKAGDACEAPAYKQKLYFSIAEPPTDTEETPAEEKGENNFYISVNHEKVKGSTKADASDPASRGWVHTPGGHSFGAGATKDNKATNGGGGACVESGNRNGCGGYLKLYY
jgi:hypothetical protein